MAAIRPIDAADDVDQRAFAGAVRADDGANFAWVNRQVDIGQCHDAAERQADALERKQRSGDTSNGADRLAVVFGLLLQTRA